MSIENISIPISEGSNIFPAGGRVPLSGNRKDTTITSITSGTDGNIRIQALDILTAVEIGDFVSYATDFYTPRSVRVTNVIDPNTIEVDDRFRSSISSNSFLNFKKDWFLEVRYVESNSIPNDQNAISLFDFTTEIASATDSTFSANISLPAEQITPTIDFTTGQKTNLSVSYKVQYRESWRGARSESWISYMPDLPVLLIHGAEPLDVGFQDPDDLKRFVKGYPLIYSYVYSSVADEAGENQVTVFMDQYNIRKELNASETVGIFTNVNGVVLFNIDTTAFLNDTVFVKFRSSVTNNIGDYSPEDYSPEDYKTVGESTVYPYTYPFEQA